jgi:hypothetical protein
MQPKVRTNISILTLGTEASAVSENCLEVVEVTPYDIHALIRHQACQMLPHTLTHDARLPVIHGETLFEEDRSNVR